VKAYNTSRHESDFSNEVSGIAKWKINHQVSPRGAALRFNT
jgi:hypothetical protein